MTHFASARHHLYGLPGRWWIIPTVFVLAPMLVFFAFAEEIAEHEPMSWDGTLLRHMTVHSRLLDPVMVFLSSLGGGEGVVLLGAAAFAFLVTRRRYEDAVFLAASFEGAHLLGRILKDVFDRPRPALVAAANLSWSQHTEEIGVSTILLILFLLALATRWRRYALLAVVTFAVAAIFDLLAYVSISTRVGSDSFPSGHAVADMALAAPLVILTWPTRHRRWVTGAGVLFVFAVGLSRLCLGLHYPSDVAAGWCLALAWTAVLWLAYSPHRRSASAATTAGPSALLRAGKGRTTIDYLVNAAVVRDLPGLVAALDGDVMRGLIGEALLQAPDEIQVCTPGKIKYLPGEVCIVRYDLRVAGADWIATGRVFPDPGTAARHVRQRLAPLAERAAEHSGTGPFARLAASIEPLAVAMSVFPVDADLPALVEATDPPLMLEWLNACLGERYKACEIQAVSYSRQGRCVLRYDLDAVSRGRRTVYGKLTTGGDGVHARAVLEELRAGFASDSSAPVNLPRPLGYDERLGLLLMDPVKGIREVRELVEAWGAGDAAAVRALEERLNICAHTGALLHHSGVRIGALRTIAGELADLRADLRSIERIEPRLSARLAGWLERAEHLSAFCPPQSAGLAHGDFTISQILFDERGTVTLLDFDDVCQAEPALDLGQFTAYLKLGAAKHAGAAEHAQPLVRRFLDSYAQDSGHDPQQLAARHAVYEICAFARLAINAWHKLKPSRLANVLDALEQASAW